MSEFPKGNFVALHRGEDVDLLQERFPSAYLLLSLIARRARYQKQPCPITGLGYGQAFVGDFRKAGLKTESSYRKAKTRLEEMGFCTFLGKKSGANRGTIATLQPQGIFSFDGTGGANGGTIKERSKDDQMTDHGRQTTKEPRNQGTKKPIVSRDPLRSIIEEIYQHYPKKVGKPQALKAIRKSLSKMDPESLLEKTKAFALARKDEDHQFTPNPATWFNQERYNDDPQTWKPSRDPYQKPQAQRCL